MEKNTQNITVIPEERIKDALKNIKESTSVCPKCGHVIITIDYPYAYDPENNEIVYASICPECDEILFSRD